MSEVEMTEVVDETVDADDQDDSDELEVSGKRKPRGKRDIFFICAAIVDGNLVMEEVSVTKPATAAEVFDKERGRNEAIESFKTKHGIEPQEIKGSYYHQKGIPTVHKKRESLRVDAKSAPFNGKMGTGIHKVNGVAWEVVVNYTAKPDVVFVHYDALANPESTPKEKRVKPAQRWLNPNIISNLKEISSVD